MITDKMSEFAFQSLVSSSLNFSSRVNATICDVYFIQEVTVDTVAFSGTMVLHEGAL